MSLASSKNNDETSSTTRCKLGINTQPVPFNTRSPPTARHEPRRPFDTATPPTTPLPLPAMAALEPKEEGKEEGECGLRSQISGLFPCAGRPLPGEVLECLFAWLRSLDLSALYSSSKAGASPGERDSLDRVKRNWCVALAVRRFSIIVCRSSSIQPISVHMQSRTRYNVECTNVPAARFFFFFFLLGNVILLLLLLLLLLFSH